MYLLELTEEGKRATEDLHFFESIEEIYEYIQDNTAEMPETEEGRLIRID